MIDLEVFGRTEAMQRVAARLDERDGVSRVRLVDATREGHSVVSASLHPRTVDAVLDDLRRQGVPDEDIALARVELIGSLATGRAEAGIVWADVVGTAWLNARPIARYLAFMLVAGVIAGYGVLDENDILIVGAMAVSPDLLPITGIAVGAIARLPGLAARALLTLALGLGVASAAAAVSTFAQDRLDLVRPASPSSRPACSEVSRRSVTKRSSSRSSRAWPGCWRSRPAPAPAWAWRSR
jgi:hypothetical protein